MIVSRGKRKPARKVQPIAAKVTKGLCVGDLVIPSDLNNYGTIVGIVPGKPRKFIVRFRNPQTGNTAEVAFTGNRIRLARDANLVTKAQREAADKASRQAAHAAMKRERLLECETAPMGRDMTKVGNGRMDPNGLRSAWNISLVMTADESAEWLGADGYSVRKVSTLNPHVKTTRKDAEPVERERLSRRPAGGGHDACTPTQYAAQVQARNANLKG